jgi:hypothetical protein
LAHERRAQCLCGFFDVVGHVVALVAMYRSQSAGQS